MSITKKYRACIITFTLLFSMLPFYVSNINYAKAQDPFDEDMNFSDLLDIFLDYIDFNDPLNPHPFRFVGVWDCNKTTTINGEITFNLYFSSPLSTRLGFLGYRDSVNIRVYYEDEFGNINKEPLKNLNETVELQPNLAGGQIQSTQVSLKNINQTVKKGASLIFAVEIIQSEKWIQDFVENRYDSKWENRILGLADLLKADEDPTLADWGIFIEDVIVNKSKEFGISGETLGELFNALFSSAFYYGSDSHASSVSFKTSEDDDKTLYFKNEPSELQYSFYYDIGLPYEKNMNETKPTNSTDHSWPPISAISEVVDLALSSLSNETDLKNITTTSDTNDAILWLAVWYLKTYKESEIPSGNILIYYLHNDNIMDKARPKESSTIRTVLSEEPVTFTGDSFSRNMILENATAKLYIYYPKILTLGTVEINVTLKNGDTIIASDTKEIDRTTLIELLKRGPDNPTVFYFDKFKEDQIWYNKDISLEISVSDKPALSFLRPITINYDSTNYPSSLILRYTETDNIQVGEVKDKTVYAGGSAKYVFNVTSKYKEDNIKITVEEQESIGGWTIVYYPTSVNIGENDSATIHLFVNSTATDDSAYDRDMISLLINASGKTGFSSKPTNVTVSFDAVVYGIEIITPDSLEIKHGSNGTYEFIVRNRNKGFIADTYNIEVTSEHNFPLLYNTYIGTKSEPLDVYTDDDLVEAILNVTITAPWYTDISSDVLTFNITSDKSVEKQKVYSKETTVKTIIVTPNILESLYKLFESAAQKIGLSGRYAGWILIGVLLVLLIIIVIILMLLKKRKFVDIICLERIKEITPDQTAEFELTVRNPYKSVLTYEFKTLIDSSTNSFDISLDTSQAIIESKQSTKIKLIVKPTDYVKKDDWIEVKVVGKALDKKKSGEISTVTTIKESDTKVDISGVFHWPRVFKKGDRVETSFKLVNRGNVSARNISVILYVNGEEKNKVEDITIPRGGYADIAIPWIAVKGKNEVYIVVK